MGEAWEDGEGREEEGKVDKRREGGRGEIGGGRGEVGRGKGR